MLEYVKGKLVEATMQIAVLEAAGVGYRLFLPLSAFSKLPAAGQELILYTTQLIKEPSQVLYGFISKQERNLFEILIGVSGIGPKTALSLLGHLSINDLMDAIRCNALAILSKVPGIGRKTAERLVLEVRDKLPEWNLLTESSAVPSQAAASSQLRDAASALIHLGYSQAQAEKASKQALKELGEDADLSVLITHALRKCQ